MGCISGSINLQSGAAQALWSWKMRRCLNRQLSRRMKCCRKKLDNCAQLRAGLIVVWGNITVSVDIGQYLIGGPKSCYVMADTIRNGLYLKPRLRVNQYRPEFIYWTVQPKGISYIVDSCVWYHTVSRLL